MANTLVTVYDDTLEDIADAIRGKNGSPDTYKPGEMPAAITAIPSGGGVGIPREVDADGKLIYPTQNTVFSLPPSVTDLGNSVLYGAFEHYSAYPTDIDLRYITTISGNDALYSFAYTGSNRPILKTIDFRSLTTVSGRNAFRRAFWRCNGVTSINFSSLTTVSASDAFNSAFSECSSLTSIDLGSLATMSGPNAFYYTFEKCTGLTSVVFSSLATVSGDSCLKNAFSGCTHLTSVSFPALTANSFGSKTNQFETMLSGCSNVTVHFPAAVQSTIGSWSDVTGGFGGTNTTVLFDL